MSLQDLKKRPPWIQSAGNCERHRFRCRRGCTPTARASATASALGRVSWRELIISPSFVVSVLVSRTQLDSCCRIPAQLVRMPWRCSSVRSRCTLSQHGEEQVRPDAVLLGVPDRPQADLPPQAAEGRLHLVQPPVGFREARRIPGDMARAQHVSARAQVAGRVLLRAFPTHRLRPRRGLGFPDFFPAWPLPLEAGGAGSCSTSTRYCPDTRGQLLRSLPTRSTPRAQSLVQCFFDRPACNPCRPSLKISAGAPRSRRPRLGAPRSTGTPRPPPRSPLAASPARRGRARSAPACPDPGPGARRARAAR